MKYINCRLYIFQRDETVFFTYLFGNLQIKTYTKLNVTELCNPVNNFVQFLVRTLMNYCTYVETDTYLIAPHPNNTLNDTPQ